MSKMGISTLQSYRGAQIFEAIGSARAFVDRYFTGTPTPSQGVGLDRASRARRVAPAPVRLPAHARLRFDPLDPGGQYRCARAASATCGTRTRSRKLQHAVRAGNDATCKEYSAPDQRAERAAHHAARPVRLRAAERAPVPIDEVEPAKEIVKRFATGAMSLGSISNEAHENLAIAMNRIGGQSNTGEGGEDPSATRRANGDSRRSAIKQVASGRFGVTTDYLVNADELQIKMAQGAKPGEGGQLPGHKVDDVHRARCATRRRAWG